MGAVAGLILAFVFFALPSWAAPPGYVVTALKDGARPEGEVQSDSARKPAGVVAFAGIHQGSVVMDLVPHEAYFTRIFAVVVGPKGHVYDAGMVTPVWRHAPGVEGQREACVRSRGWS